MPGCRICACGPSALRNGVVRLGRLAGDVTCCIAHRDHRSQRPRPRQPHGTSARAQRFAAFGHATRGRCGPCTGTAMQRDVDHPRDTLCRRSRTSRRPRSGRGPRRCGAEPDTHQPDLFSLERCAATVEPLFTAGVPAQRRWQLSRTMRICGDRRVRNSVRVAQPSFGHAQRGVDLTARASAIHRTSLRTRRPADQLAGPCSRPLLRERHPGDADSITATSACRRSSSHPQDGHNAAHTLTGPLGIVAVARTTGLVNGVLEGDGGD